MTESLGQISWDQIKFRLLIYCRIYLNDLPCLPDFMRNRSYHCFGQWKNPGGGGGIRISEIYSLFYKCVLQQMNYVITKITNKLLIF